MKIRGVTVGGIHVWVLALLALLAVSPGAGAQADPDSRAENRPVAPFHIVGNIYYVGASDVTSFLIVTPAGDILLDGGFVETAPQIETNMAKLGFKLSDVKILLNSHAHFDHAGGLAQLKRRTGAQFVAMQPDAAILAHGGHGDFYFGDRLTFPPIKPDRIVHDGERVTLGGVTLTAHLTAGHTRGCTTWTMTTNDDGKPLHVVFIGSMSVLSGYRLAGKESYPGMAADYERSFRLLRSLPCDVFLASHGQFFDLTSKREALAHSQAKNPFIDPAGYGAYLDRSERAFHTELRRQQAALKPHSSSAVSPPRGCSCCSNPVLLKVSDSRDRPEAAQKEPPARERTPAALMQVEREWLAALERRDVATLARILGAEFIDTDYQGDAVPRSVYLSYFARPAAHSAPHVTQRFEDTRVRFPAPGVAIVTGEVVRETKSALPGADSATAGSPLNSVQHSRFTDVFVWRDGRWQAVTGQETHFSPAAK